MRHGATVTRLALVVPPAIAVRVGLDALLAGGSMLFVMWALVLGDTHGSGSVLTRVFPAAGFTGLALAFVTMSRVPARSRPAWVLVTAGFAALVAADCVYAYALSHGEFVAGRLSDIFWVAGFFLLGLAGLARAVVPRPAANDHEEARVPAQWELLLPHAGVTVAFLTAFYEHRRDGFRGELVAGGILLVLLLIARQVLALLENHRLARELEERVADRTAEVLAGQEHFRSVVQGISDLVLVIDADHAVRYVTPSIEPMLGLDADDVLGRSALDLLHPDDLGSLAPARAAVRGNREAMAHAEVRLRRGDGTWLPVEVTLTNMLDVPAVRGHVVTVRDIGERKELQERLRHQAFHDPLTGLANRARLHERLGELVAAGRRPSLVLLDLDEFKALNDTAGHELGDEVLVAVAERLQRCTRPGDVVARLGGDEFAVLIDDRADEASLVVARRVLQALGRPLPVRGRLVRTGASLGVARVRPDGDANQVLRDADVAMYVAKANGKHRFEVFTDAMHADVVRRRRLEDRLRDAVATGDLALHYQPLVDLCTRAVLGVEALVRLPDGDGGLVPPGDFVPLAEETGLVVPMGAWVLRTACRQAAEWQALRPDGPPLQVSVNLAVRQLQDPGLCELVAEALDAAALPAGLLTLEITEGALAADAGVDATLHRLRSLGVRLSIDDFGAGYSSLGRLRDFPVDELKIDRSFVREITSRDAPAPIVGAVISMATSLGLDVVAEGIEEPEQAANLAGRGCRTGQGFLFARPMPAGELAARLVHGNLITKDSTPLHQTL